MNPAERKRHTVVVGGGTAGRPGAVHVPFWRVGAHLDRLRQRSSDGPVVVYCGHGPRAWWAAWRLRAAGFETELLEGHWSRWRRSGLPVE